MLEDKDIIIVLEERIAQEERNEIAEYITTYNYEICSCNEFETTARWYKGIRKALEQFSDTILVLPGDIVSIKDEDVFKKAIKEMIEKTDKKSMVVGDYKSTDPFKENFDSHYAFPLLCKLFPDEAEKIRELEVTKLRSEYFSIGSEIIDNAFIKQRFRWLPLYITMLLMIAK